jgi:regulator of sigma E protease
VSLLVDSVLPFVGVLLVLVIIHELGHFLTAKAFGVKVLEFGFGFPPRLLAVKRGETEYSINVLPLGGFVRLLGEEDPTDPRSLAAQPAWRRLIVMGSGSFMNFVLAIALFSIALMMPRELPVGRAQIVQVVPGSPAEMAGLEPGDLVYTIDGRDVRNVSEVSYNIRLHLGETIPIVVRRTDPVTGESSFVTVRVRPRWNPKPFEHVVRPGEDVAAVSAATGYDRNAVRQAAGIKTALEEGVPLSIAYRGETLRYMPLAGETVSSVARRLNVSEQAVAAAAGLPDPDVLTPGGTLRFAQGATGIQIASQFGFTESYSEGPLSALRLGFRQTFDALKLARNEVIRWAKGAGSPAVSGPIGIAQATGEVVREAGWKSLTDFAALLSINLAILNILPLPMLDGGRMTFVLIEVVRRGKRIAPAKEALVHFVGMVVMLLLVVILSYFDVSRIISGESLFR